MFGCFFAATMASFVCIFLAPLAVRSKLLTVPVALFSLLTAAAAAIAAGISTGIWTVLQTELRNYAADIHIVADLGVPMFVFQWVAAGCGLGAALLQIGLMCCGTSRRKVLSGRRDSRGGWRWRTLVDEKGGPA